MNGALMETWGLRQEAHRGPCAWLGRTNQGCRGRLLPLVSVPGACPVWLCGLLS